MRRVIAHRRAAFVGGVLAVALLGGALAAAQEIATAGDAAISPMVSTIRPISWRGQV